MDWDSISMMTPAATSVQLSVPPVDDALDPASTWPTLGMNNFDQYSPPWDTGLDLDQTDSLFNPDAGLSIAMPTPYSLPTPPKSVSPPGSTYLASIDTLAITRPEKAECFNSSDAFFELLRSTSNCTSALQLPR